MFKREKPPLAARAHAAAPDRTAGPGAAVKVSAENKGGPGGLPRGSSGGPKGPARGQSGSANDKNASTIDKNGRGGRARRETEKEAMA